MTKSRRFFGGMLILVLCLNLVGWFQAGPVRAAASGELPFAGRLTTNGGSNVADADYPVTFRLYSVPTGGTALWTENQTVTVSRGEFAVRLGSVTSLSGVDFNQAALYLGFQVGSDPEMSPRYQVGSVPSSLTSNLLDGKSASQFFQKSQNETVTGAVTFNGGVALAGLLPGQLLYGTAGNAVAALPVSSNGLCLVMTAGAPAWGSCTGGGALDLQSTYDAGNSITTTNARDLTVNLANTATDANLLFNIATGSTGKVAVQASGTDIFRVAASGVTIVGDVAVTGNVTSGTWHGTAIDVAYGGTGTTGFTSNGVLYGNGTGAVQSTAAGTSGQLLVAGGLGVPAFVSLSSDATLSSAGALTIASNAVTSAKILNGTIAPADLSASDYSSQITSGTYSINISGGAGTVSNGVYTNAANIITAPADSSVPLSLKPVNSTGTGHVLDIYNNGAIPVVASYFSAAGLFNGSGAGISANTVANGSLANSSITINNGTGISGGGLVSLGGSLTLSLPQAIATSSSPTFAGLNLGSGSITSGPINKLTITPPATGATLTIADGKTLTVNNSLTLSGTDGTVMTFPASSTTLAGLGIAQTFTAAQTNSTAGQASTPAQILTGAWLTSGGTATTTKPQLLIEPAGTASTAWSTNGTGFGVNAGSSFTGNLVDLQVAASSKFSVSSTGAVTAAGTIQSTATTAALWASSTSPASGAALLRLGNALSGGSTNGTYLGVNAGSGFTGDLALFQVNNISKLRVDQSGVVYFGTTQDCNSGCVKAGELDGSANLSLIAHGSGNVILQSDLTQALVANTTSVSLNVDTTVAANKNLILAAGTGKLSIGTASANGTLDVRQSATGTIALYVKAIASATANLVQIDNSSGTPLFVVDPTGHDASGESLPGVPLVGVDPNSGATKGDLTSSSGPLRPSAGAGFTLNISAGSAYTADATSSQTKIARCNLAADTTLSITSSSTQYVYVTASGAASTTGITCQFGQSATVPTFDPSKPVLVLAKVVADGSSITSVTDTRFFLGGSLNYVKTAAATDPGSVVIMDTSADNQVKLTTSAADTGVSGIVVVGNTGAGTAIIMSRGAAWAAATTTAVRSACAGTSTTSGAVKDVTAAITACVGQGRTAASASTPAVLVSVNPQ